MIRNSSQFAHRFMTYTVLSSLCFTHPCFTICFTLPCLVFLDRLTARPEYASVHFVLLTTFPNRELTDETQTLEAGKLLNAVIMQRIK